MLSPILAADVWFENMLLGIRTPFFLHLFSWITFLGNTAVVIAITAIALLFFYKKRSAAYAAGLAGAVIGAGTAHPADGLAHQF